jgi:hypothetical protein
MMIFNYVKLDSGHKGRCVIAALPMTENTPLILHGETYLIERLSLQTYHIEPDSLYLPDVIIAGTLYLRRGYFK